MAGKISLAADLCAKIYESRSERFFREWGEFLEFRSISTDARHETDCRACAEWLVKQARAIGFRAELLDTPSKPVVYAHFKGKPAAPRVLYYGHYDVQPVDPLEAWTSEPFSAHVRNGRLYARGAQDNKGQTFYVLKALETLIEQKALDCDVTLLIEGEEESGSQGLSASLGSWAQRLASDVLLVCDTGALRPAVPCITMGLRGIISAEVWLGGISHDLHSGALGGVVKNPAVEMARLIASLHDQSGKIAVEGYYDGVPEPAAAERGLANASWVGDEAITAFVGIPPLGGESTYTSAERRGFRPTLEINGLHAGYGGPGVKTIIPAEATAKITSRIVTGQDPARCLELLCNHLERRAPRGLRFEIRQRGVGGGALALSVSHPLMRLAKRVLDEVSGVETQFTWEGGSIPVVAELAKVSGAAPLLVGYGLEEDRMHAPDESFSLSQFRLGYLSVCMLLQAIAAEVVRADGNATGNTHGQ